MLVVVSIVGVGRSDLGYRFWVTVDMPGSRARQPQWPAWLQVAAKQQTTTSRTRLLQIRQWRRRRRLSMRNRRPPTLLLQCPIIIMTKSADGPIITSQLSRTRTAKRAAQLDRW